MCDCTDICDCREYCQECGQWVMPEGSIDDDGKCTKCGAEVTD